MTSDARFPIYTAAARIGEQGFTIVKRIVERELHWLFRKNHQENDFGIDAYIDVVSEFGQVTGKSIAIQLKTGESYFQNRSDRGWIYSGKVKHLNYYLNHDIPVVLILVDDVKEKAFWCLCDPMQMERAEETWKITIPFKSELGELSKKELSTHISPIRDYASQLEDFWATNKAIKETGRIFFLISREDVEKDDLVPLFLAFKRLEVNPDLLVACKSKVDVVIDGYNDDPRELRDIPEVRSWVGSVFNGIDGWAYYLPMDEQSQFLRLLQLFNMKYQVTDSSSKRDRIEFDFSSSRIFLEAMYGNLNRFCARHSISEEINKEVSFKMIEFFTGQELPDEMKK